MIDVCITCPFKYGGSNPPDDRKPVSAPQGAAISRIPECSPLGAMNHKCMTPGCMNQASWGFFDVTPVWKTYRCWKHLRDEEKAAIVLKVAEVGY